MVYTVPVPVAGWSKASMCGRSPAEIVGSNPAGGMDVVYCKCCVLSGRQDDHSSRGVLQTVKQCCV
jgi:hypothetical protein